MSSYAKSTKRDNRPFCATCKNAGLSEKEYRGHYTKSNPGPTGVVICATILSFECGYCHKRGHTTKHCDLITYKNAGSKPETKAVATKATKAATKAEVTRAKEKDLFMKKISMNKFLAFSDDSDSESEHVAAKTKATESFPPISHNTPVPEPNHSSNKRSYKSMLESSPAKPIISEVPFVTCKYKYSEVPMKIFYRSKRSWADDTSSDEDEN